MNGEAEVTNRTILHGLKIRLTDAKNLWAEELQSVLWAYRTTHQILIRETPFRLTYGTKAVIPVEIGLLSNRVRNFHEVTNSDQLKIDLNLLDGIIEQAYVRMMTYK